MNLPYAYVCLLFPEIPSSLPPHPIPPGCHRALALRFLHHTSNSHWLSILRIFVYVYVNVYVSMLFSQIIPPSPSPTESKNLFFILTWKIPWTEELAGYSPWGRKESDTT